MRKRDNLYFLAVIAIFSSFRLAAQADSVFKKLDSVIVFTGQYQPKTVANSVFRVRVITPQNIKMRGAADVLGVLNTELGIRLSTDYVLGETDIQLMGMSGNNVKVLIDGVPVIDRDDTRQSLSQLNINDVEKIEIVEGPMSVVYGTDALAGVINIITKKATASGKKNWQLSAGLLEETVPGEYQPLNGNGVHNQHIRVAYAGTKGWNAAASYARNYFGGWEGNPPQDRTKEIKPKNQDLAGAEIGYKKNKFSATYKLNYLLEDIFSEGKPTTTDPVVMRQAYVTNRYTHLAQASWQAGNQWHFNIAASLQDYERRTKNTTYNTQTGTEYLNPNASQDVSSFTTAFVRATALYKLNEVFHVQQGLEIKNDKSTGERIYTNNGITDYAYFITGEITPFSSLQIRPGLRVIKNSVYDAPPVVPSLNLKYNLTNSIVIRGAYGKGFRAPALRELYFTFHDASHDIEGNPDLKAELSNSFSLSISKNQIKWGATTTTAEIVGFYNTFKNRIAYAQDPVNANWTTLINIDEYKTAGATANATFSYKTLNTTIGTSYIGRLNNLYEYDKSLTQYLWSPEINGNIHYTLKKAAIAFALYYKYTGKVPGYVQQTVNGTTQITQVQTAGFNWLDVSAAKTIVKYITITAGVKNLLNVTRLNNTNISGGGAHSSSGPVLKSYGRSLFLSLVFNSI